MNQSAWNAARPGSTRPDPTHGPAPQCTARGWQTGRQAGWQAGSIRQRLNETHTNVILRPRKMLLVLLQLLCLLHTTRSKQKQKTTYHFHIRWFFSTRLDSVDTNCYRCVVFCFVFVILTVFIAAAREGRGRGRGGGGGREGE